MQHILVKSKRKILIDDIILGGPETQAVSSLNIVFL